MKKGSFKKWLLLNIVSRELLKEPMGCLLLQKQKDWLSKLGFLVKRLIISKSILNSFLIFKIKRIKPMIVPSGFIGAAFIFGEEETRLS